MKKRMFLASLLAVMLGCGSYRMSSPPVARADEASDQVAVVIHVDALPTFAAEGRAQLRRYVTSTRKDEGAVRIEVFEELARPNHSTLVEVWKSRKAYDDHLGLEHTKTFRSNLQPMLGSPFDERLHRIAP